MKSRECAEAEGNVLGNYDCAGSFDVCCDEQKEEKTCEEEGGFSCDEDENCDGITRKTSDVEKCCIGECEPKTSACEQLAYKCRSNCLDDEESVEYKCASGETCCREIEGKSYWYIYLLVVLIILAVIGIIFRNKLRVLIFRFKGGFKQGEVTKTRPYFPPSVPSYRGMIPTQGRMPQAKPSPKTQTDKELEETLKKLKEISK